MLAIRTKRLLRKIASMASYREEISVWTQLGIVLVLLAIAVVYVVLVWHQMELRHAEELRQLLQRQRSG